MKTLELTRAKSEDGKILFIADDTDTYGTDLPARNTLALVPYFTFKPAGGAVETVEPETFSPSDVATFSIDVEDRDGVYYTRVYALQKYTSGPLDEGDIVYNTGTQRPEIMTADGLAAIAVADLADHEDDINYGEIESLIDTALVIARAELVLVVLQKLKDAQVNKCEIFEYNEVKQNYDYVDLALFVAKTKFCAGEFEVAQQELETGLDVAIKTLEQYQ